MTNELSHETRAENFVRVLWARFRRELLERPALVLGVFLALLLLAALFYWPIRVTKYGKLTELEQLLFQLFLVALSGAISWILAKRQEERNVLAKQKALASSAVRRIASIAAAADRLFEIIEARKVAAKSEPEWADMEPIRRSLLFELFDSLSRQVVEMRDNIEASEGDWRDILPEEFARKRQAETEILKAREAAIQQKQRALEDLQQALTRGEARTAEQISALREAFARQLEATAQSLSVKVEQIRSRLASTVSVPYSGWETQPLYITNQPFVWGQNEPFVILGTPADETHQQAPQSGTVPDAAKVAVAKAEREAKAQEKEKKEPEKPEPKGLDKGG